MKLQISLNDDLLQRVDRFAEDNYLSRSGLISQALVQYLNANEAVLAVKDLSVAVRKIADSGVMDSESQKILDDFQRIAQMLITGR